VQSKQYAVVRCPDGHALVPLVEVGAEGRDGEAPVKDVDPMPACPICGAAVPVTVDRSADLETFTLVAVEPFRHADDHVRCRQCRETVAVMGWRPIGPAGALGFDRFKLDCPLCDAKESIGDVAAHAVFWPRACH
jgi:hypothetical protein